MTDLSVIWEDSALQLLEDRDRYTRNAIREQFSRDPNDGAIQFDPDNDNVFLTPVSDGRFSVVWCRDGNRALVRAVVPLPNLPIDKAALERAGALTEFKAYVQRAVQVESHGKIRI